MKRDMGRDVKSGIQGRRSTREVQARRSSLAAYLPTWVRRRFRRGTFAACAVLGLLALASRASAAVPLDEVLARTAKHVSKFLDQFSQVKCTEQVVQEKLSPKGKVEHREESKYDYLVILTNAGGEVMLDESRLADHEAKHKKNLPLLVTNGFATLFLVFHPAYQGSFKFEDLGVESMNGQAVVKVGFRHVRGMRSPTALLLRGREYPLDLEGRAWIEPQSGSIIRMEAGIGQGMEDVGLRRLSSRVEYGNVFRDTGGNWLFPTLATIEVETPRQYWRNTHRFTDYKRFQVSTEETVASKP